MAACPINRVAASAAGTGSTLPILFVDQQRLFTLTNNKLGAVPPLVSLRADY